jgi:ParB family chromosome partitioning protein
MTIHLIPLDHLLRSKRNARKTRTGGVDDLAASILAHGLLQNLSVLPIDPLPDDGDVATGRFEVIAGGRRLAALKKLAREKKIPRGHPVPCEILSGCDPIEISLAENALRQSMHPADEFEAFQSLAVAGHGPEEIAARFGVTAAVVKQRLKLAAISPKLMAEYRAGGIELDHLMALTLSDDHAAQERAWFESATWDRHPARLRAILTKAAVQPGDRRVRFVGLDAYLAAGGGLIRDLFQENHDGYLTDAGLLDRLVAEQLEREAETVRGEGWRWVEIRADLSDTWRWQRLAPEAIELSPDDRDELRAAQERLAELPDDDGARSDAEAEEADRLFDRIARLEMQEHRWRPEDMAASGAVLTLGYAGEVRVERGLIRPGDTAPSDTAIDDGDIADKGDDSGARGNRRAESDRLVEDLTAHRTAALRAVVGDDTEAALTVLVHALALRLFRIGGEFETCLTLSVVPEDLSQHAEGIAATPAMAAVEERHRRWGNRLPGEAVALWEWLVTQSRDERLDLLAHCISLLIHGVRVPHAGEERTLAAGRLATLAGLDMGDWWQATAESYLARVSKARILAAVAEAVSPEEAAKLGGLKKAELVEAAEALLKDRRWLPAVLRSSASNDLSAVPDTEALDPVC